MQRPLRALAIAAALILAGTLPATALAAPLIGTTTTVSVSPATADAGAEGGSIAWTINVTPDSGGPATGTGTYTLSDSGGTIATNSFPAAQSSFTVTVSGFSAGTYTLAATYPGDGAFGPSSGSADGTFAKVATTTTVTVSPAVADTGAEGGDLAWTINVTRDTGSGPVAGDGTYTLTGPNGPLATNSFPASQSNYTVTVSGFPAGDYTLDATYPGDSTFESSSGSAQASFAKVATTTTVTVSPASAPTSSSITWTISVTRDTGSGPVAGNGTYTLTGPSGPIATNPFNAATAAFTVTASGLSAGTYTLDASYPGDTTFLASSGSANGTFLSGTDAVHLTSSQNPSLTGQAVTFTAVVTGTGGTPTGSVTFKDGSTTLGSGTLNGSGTATLTVSGLAQGSHSIVASYSGDGTFSATDSSTLTQVVNAPQPPTTAASLAPAANAAGWNKTSVGVTLTATPGAGAAPVAATYYAIDDAACTPAARSSCHTYSSSFSVSADGTHTVTFFSVDALGAAEALKSVTVRIDKVAPTTTATPTSSPDGSGKYRAPVTVNFLATDATSGVDHTEIKLDSGAWTTVGGSTTVSTNGIHTLAYRSIDRAGNVEATHTLTLHIDLVRPSLSITPAHGTPQPHLPLFTATGTATFLTSHGVRVGTAPVTCFDTRGLVLTLAGSSGSASLTYSETGAQSIGPKTVTGSSASARVSAAGLTSFTGIATDASGNSSSPLRWAVIVGSSNGPISCAMPLGSLSAPSHGSIIIVARIQVRPGFSVPFTTVLSY